MYDMKKMEMTLIFFFTHKANLTLIYDVNTVIIF